MLSSLIAGAGLPVLVRFVSDILGTLRNPAAQNARRALDHLGKALEDGQISHEEMREANRHIEAMTRMRAERDSAALAEINASLRKEAESNDPYVRRMRPTFGYLMAATWAAQMFALAYVMIFKTQDAPHILNAMASLGAIWGIGLSVLGIYVYKRSEDKKRSAFSKPASKDMSAPETVVWNGPRAAGAHSDGEAP